MVDTNMNVEAKNIVLGGGCFWCVEAVFRLLKGILSVTPGYAGGEIVQPSYEQVCSGETGHAEVVRVEYDPNIISLRQILSVFFSTHDPTTPDRQGNDAGTQYRSVIFYETQEDKEVMEKFIEQLKESEIFQNPIVTEVQKLPVFYKAEDYHKAYYERNQDKPYCQLVINPKLEKLRKNYESLLK